MRHLDVYDTVVFDLDGTLLDTLEDLWGSVNYALDQMGYPGRTLDEVRRFVGNGVGKLVERAVPGETPDEAAARCLGIFRGHYNEHMEDKTAPYPGILSLLTNLKEWGFQVGVVSNKYDGAVKDLCRKYFDGLVGAAVGERENARRKPAPDGVQEVLGLLGSEPGKTLYVGDSDVDMQTAKNACVASMGVTWGFQGEEELTAAGADYLATRPYHIWNMLVTKNQGIEYEADWKTDCEGVVLSGREQGMRDCPFLSQSDRRWKDVTIGKTGTLEDDGCGPAALAMAAGALTGRSWGLPEVARWVEDNGYFCEGKGCYHRLIPEGGTHFGLRTEALGADGGKMIQALREKKMVAALVGCGHFSGGGHFILLRGITEDGKILVADPGSLQRSKARWDADLILSELSRTAGSGGPLWALWV